MFRQGKIDLAALTDVVAFYFPLELDLKLRLIEEPTPDRRALLLLESFKGAAAEGAGRPSSTASQTGPAQRTTRFPPRFGDN